MFDEVLRVVQTNLPTAREQPAMTREEYKRRLGVVDPAVAPWPWGDVLEKLKTTPNLLDHFLARAYAPPGRSEEENRSRL